MSKVYVIFHKLIKYISILLKTVITYEPSKYKSSQCKLNIKSDCSFIDAASP